MNLEQFATPLKAKNNFIKASFGGFSGSGKTRTASEFIIGCYKKFGIQKPLLFIDNEKGSRFLVPLFRDNGIEAMAKDTTSLADVLTAMDFLNKGEIGFLFIDSLSKIWYKYIRDYKDANKLKFMTLQDWGKILPEWQEKFADRFVELNGNCVFTGRGGFTYDVEEEEKAGGGTKKTFVKSGVKMKLAGETPFEPDLNIWMEQEQEMVDGKPVIWRTGMVMKDRSALIDGKIFKNPSFKDFEPVVDFLIGVPKGDVAGISSTQNLAPSEDWDRQNKKDQRTIYLEDIKAQFDAMALGTSNEAKQIKVHIMENLFETAAWLAVEKLQLEKLQRGINILKEFRREYEINRPETLEDIKTLLKKAIDSFELFAG